MPVDAPPAPHLPRRVGLRPGIHVVRRDERRLQVGLSAPRCVVVPDEPDVVALLDALRSTVVGPRPASVAAARVLRDLDAAGLLVDADEVATHLARGSGASTAAVTATFARHGTGAGPRLAARTAATVGVVPLGRAGLDVRLLHSLLAEVGLRVLPPPERPDVYVVAGRGELSRSVVDPLLQEGAPHLVLGTHDGSLRLGPFVEPGVTACLRCVDAHDADADPRRPFLLEQHAAAAVAGAGEPVDPLLVPLALAWAAHDLVRYVEGDQPSTWSATVTLAEPGGVRHDWKRHPHCGCAWDELPA